MNSASLRMLGIVGLWCPVLEEDILSLFRKTINQTKKMNIWGLCKLEGRYIRLNHWLGFKTQKPVYSGNNKYSDLTEFFRVGFQSPGHLEILRPREQNMEVIQELWLQHLISKPLKLRTTTILLLLAVTEFSINYQTYKYVKLLGSLRRKGSLIKNRWFIKIVV